MARKVINIGTVANDKTGTKLRTAFSWINDMTEELYAFLEGMLNLNIGTRLQEIEEAPILGDEPTVPTPPADDDSERVPNTGWVVAKLLAMMAAQDAMVFKNVIDCSANPNYPAADAGWTYRVSVAGKIGGAAGTVVKRNDLLVCISDGTLAGDQATVGASWAPIPTNDDGAVIGPAGATNLRIAVFDGITGKLLADGGKTIADLRKPSVQSLVSAATVTATFDDDLVKVTAQAAALLLANPTGTSIPGHGIVFRIKDNGTARAIIYDTQFRAIGVTLPTSTVVNKTLYLGCIWNAEDTKLDVVAVAQEA